MRVSEKRVVAGDYDIRQALRNFRSYVEKNCENVGENFASEARLISKGKAKNRNIYGKVSSKDAEDLKDEGIEVTQFHGLKMMPNFYTLTMPKLHSLFPNKKSN